MPEATSPIDTILTPYLQATDEALAQDALTELLATHAHPVIRRLIRSKMQVNYFGNGHTANHQDADDLFSDVITQLLTDLRGCRQSPHENPIHHFSGFVARLTLNACYKQLRAKYPQRHHLKNKVRYLLTRQPGFALWEKSPPGLVCGYAAWQEQARFSSPRLQEICADPTGFAQRQFPQRSIPQINPAELVAAIFAYVGTDFE